MTPISHSKPWITSADIQAVEAVLASNMLAQGELTGKLEQQLSSWIHALEGVAAGSGSAALVLALYGVGVRRGDEVILPTYVCKSVYEAVLTTGGVPVLCDVGEDWVITANCVAQRIGQRTRAIIVPHMYGVFADVGSFRQFGVPVIEDCAQAVDGCGRRSTSADVAVFSLHPTKCVTAGEGGIAVSSDPEILARMRGLRDGADTFQGWRLFSPLSDIAAGLALSQLQRYPEILARRAQIADRYTAALEMARPDCLNRRIPGKSMFFRFPIRVSGGIEACAGRFLDLGIHVRRGVDVLLHRLTSCDDRDFPTSVKLYDTTVSLPIYPALGPDEESRCVAGAAAVLPHLTGAGQ